MELSSIQPFAYRLNNLNFINDEDLKTDSKFNLNNTHLPSKSILLNQGDVMRDMYIVQDGWAIRYKILEDGGKQILNFILPGDIIGLYSPIFLNSEVTVETLTSLNLFSYQSSRIIDLFQEKPKLALAISWIAGQDERILGEQIVRLGRRRSVKRMAHLLIELYKRLRNAGFTAEKSIELPLNQSLLGEALGLSHIHSHRAYRELEKNSLTLRSKQSIKLIDILKLADLADFDPSYLEPAIKPKLSV
ncbi:MAG: Crp/Fnr family transcriptional regulator [Gammaproteobacteria bacterium]|nr:Crp/Fnr family transcriptional regulator [Gammaproteobacteria bacterium]